MTTINMGDINKANLNEFKKKSKGLIIFLVIALLALILVSQSAYTVGESEQVVISRLGDFTKIVVNEDNTFIENNPDLMYSEGNKLENVTVSYSKGLHFKIPFIDQVIKFDSWLFTYVSESTEVNTADKKKYDITMFAQWRITNPALFQNKYKNIITANNFLDNRIYPIIIQSVNNLAAKDFINNKDLLNAALTEDLATLNESIKEGGIELYDIQIHRTTLPQANLESTYLRMIANREKIAQQKRAEGAEEYQKIVASADKKASIIVSQSILTAQTIRGEADAQALEIYANAYSADPKFYAFWRSLEAFETALKANSTLILDDTSPLWGELIGYLQTDFTEEETAKVITPTE